MRRIRDRLTYANVVASIALFLALGGGAVYAASKIDTNDIANHAVTEKKLAKHAVSNKVLDKKAVDAPNVVKGSLGPKQLARGAVFSLSATGGPVSAATANPIQLTGDTSWKAKPGEADELVATAKGRLADATAGDNCFVDIVVSVNGQPKPRLVPFLNSDGTTTLSPDSDSDEEAFIPEAGQIQTVTAATDPSSTACASGSTVDKLKIAIIRLP
jgi:hypothetical protein